LSVFGGSLRADYTQIDNLRIIAALRLDKYDKPDDLYLSYQFVGSYKLSDKHLVRAVYSRANRSAFIGNVYADFQNPLATAQSANDPMLNTLISLGALDPNQPLYYQYYIGNENLKLLTMDMVEFGHRWKISNNLQTDIELFYTQTRDFDALLPTSLDTEYINLGNLMGTGDVLIPVQHERRTYENIDVVSKQMGASFSINYMPTKKILLKTFGTYQKTNLKDYMSDENDPANLTDVEHKWTPTFYGGLSMNYNFTANWFLYANLYYMGEQVYNRYESPYGENGEDIIGEKGILNVKLSYQFMNNSSIYVSARNITNNEVNEFGFADQVGGLYMFGIHFNL